VNGLLAGGLDRNGAPPVRDLFSYDPVLGAARTIQVTDITPQEIAAASLAAPGGNGNALELAALAGSYEIDGLTFSQYFGNLSAKVGRQLAGAIGDQQAQEQLLSQARALRSETSGVSLDNEAAQLIQLQRGYQATAKLLTVLNDLTGEVLGLIG
jgi:flagellar hook-associated protein 1 FlgK